MRSVVLTRKSLNVAVRFVLSHVSPLKPHASIHKAPPKPWISLVKFLEKDNNAENYPFPQHEALQI